MAGDTLTLFVNTKAPTFHVEAYRMGYYHGVGARLVWQSEEVPGIRQSLPVIVPPNNTIECQWSPSLSITVGQNMAPGRVSVEAGRARQRAAVRPSLRP